MKFVDVEVLSADGDTAKIPVNPENVLMLVTMPIPTGLSGGDGVAIMKPGVGIDLGFRMLMVAGTEEEVRNLLEGNNNGV